VGFILSRLQDFATRSGCFQTHRRYAAEMRSYARLDRPHCRIQTARHVAPRPVAVPRTFERSSPSIALRRQSAEVLPSPSWGGFQPDPYVDYGRALTPEGGILISYKDLDLRLRHTIWRILAWTSFTGIEGWYVLDHSPVHSGWLNLACFLTVAVINWLIVHKQVEVYRNIEIRRDCMIIEGAEVFWRRSMEGGWPTFQPDKEGNQLLCGIYGTRFVE
jgi:hypothetical protein